jgi:hypothetical protein
MDQWRGDWVLHGVIASEFGEHEPFGSDGAAVGLMPDREWPTSRIALPIPT